MGLNFILSDTRLHFSVPFSHIRYQGVITDVRKISKPKKASRFQCAVQFEDQLLDDVVIPPVIAEDDAVVLSNPRSSASSKVKRDATASIAEPKT